MSKKILKRSLALGALMAFVITGSAMAAEAYYSSYSKTNTNTSTGRDYFEDTKWHGEYYSDPKNPNGDWNSLIQIEVIHTDEFESWNDFKDKHPGLEERYYPVCEKLEANVTLTGNVGFGGYNDSSSNASYNNTNLNGHKLIINHNGADYALESSGRGGSFVNEFHETFMHPENQGATCQYKHIYTGLKNLVLDLPGFNIYDSTGTGDLEIKTSNVAVLGYGKIDVDELKITSDSNSIQSVLEGANDTHKMEIAANSIEINAGVKANAIQVHNTLDVRAGKLEIKAKDTEYARAIRVAYSTAEGKSLGTPIANIDVEELNISGATESSKVSNDGILNLTAKSGAITNEFYAASTGTIDATLGAGVEWTGKFVTDTDATKGALDLSGKWTLKDVANDTIEKDKANSLTEATFREGSTFVIDGATYEKSTGKYALNGVGENAKLIVKDGAKLTVNGIAETTYNIAKGFKTVEGTKVDDNTVKYWDVTNVNALMQGVLWDNGENGLQLTVEAKDAEQMATDTGMSTSTATLVQSIIENKNNANTPAEKAAVEFIEKVQANNSAPEAVGNAINNATKMGEAGGNSATAASIVKNVTGVTNDRLSFNCGHSAPHKGGHGVGLFEEGSGADVWVEYVHGKDEVEDMPSTAGASSYEGQYNGIVMGVDFKKVNKFQSGIAFNYGEGDTNSVGNAVRTHSDYDFWGVGYYGSIHNDDSNVIFDISYAQTDSDVTQNNSGTAFEANPETTTWSAGVKLEKLYQNENVQIVPYTGLRYMSIDADDYSTRNGEFYYSMDRQTFGCCPWA